MRIIVCDAGPLHHRNIAEQMPLNRGDGPPDLPGEDSFFGLVFKLLREEVQEKNNRTRKTIWPLDRLKFWRTFRRFI
jgi:hypothetical protein